MPIETFTGSGILAMLLDQIEANDTKYQARYGLVLAAVARAHADGLAAGFRIDSSEPEWPVAYIELPTGQVSWHLPQHPNTWDGHDTAEKYRRCRAFIERAAAGRDDTAGG
jgi:hypothetical protein